MKKLILLFVLSGCAHKPVDPLAIKWQDVKSRQAVVSGQSAPSSETIKSVKAELQKYKVANDIDTYGVDDYWATPKELEKKKAGDCEDLAIYAYYELRKKGFQEKDLDIVVVQQAIWQNEDHAILTVKLDDKKYVLDNQIPIVETWDRVKNRYNIVKKLN